MFIYGLYAINTVDSNSVDKMTSDCIDNKMPPYRSRPKSFSICGQNHVIDSMKSLMNSKSLNCLLKTVKNEQLNEQCEKDEEQEREEMIENKSRYNENLMKFERNLERICKKAELDQLDSFIFNSYETNRASPQANPDTNMVELLKKRRHTTFFQNNSPLKHSIGLLTVNEENQQKENGKKKSSTRNQATEKATRKFSISNVSKMLFKNLTFHGKTNNSPKNSSPYDSKSSTRKSSRTSYNELVDRYYQVRKKHSSLSEVSFKKLN